MVLLAVEKDALEVLRDLAGLPLLAYRELIGECEKSLHPTHPGVGRGPCP